MFENILKFFKKGQKGQNVPTDSKSAAKERLHLVLMQDRANVSADFLDLMKQEIIEVIKKYIEVDESAIDVRLTNKENEDGTNGAPALYANIPILNIKNEARKIDSKEKNSKQKPQIKAEVNQKEKEEVKEKVKSEKEEDKEKLVVEKVEEVEIKAKNETEKDDSKKVKDAKNEEEKAKENKETEKEDKNTTENK